MGNRESGSTWTMMLMIRIPKSSNSCLCATELLDDPETNTVTIITASLRRKTAASHQARSVRRPAREGDAERLRREEIRGATC